MSEPHRTRRPSRIKDLTGQRFGKLVVLRQSPHAGRRIKWECQCDCGRTHAVAGCNLKSGHTRSCGCAYRDPTANPNFQHGLTHHPLFALWGRVLRRCYNQNSPEYRYYGGRGIGVCDRWRYSFPNFLADMGPRPAGMSIDRIDNDRGYEPDNCRWTDKKTQMRNRSNAVMLTFNGKTQNMVAWSEELGFPRHLLQNRLKYGWSAERALSTPNFGRSRKGVSRKPSS